jgi:hypothetical protein
MFFSEKKNQKTFATAPTVSRTRHHPCAAPKDKSLLLLFFRKEGIS